MENKASHERLFTGDWGLIDRFDIKRFDTPNDERFGKWSVNFSTNFQEDIDRAVMSRDKADAIFKRKPVTLELNLLEKLASYLFSVNSSNFP